MVHGWLLSGRLWEPLKAELEPHWDLWCPDLPGFGSRSRPRGLHPSLPSYGRWLADAAREQAAGRPLVLIGHSLGGSLVLHAAPHLGDQLAAVVQVAAGGGVYQPRPFRMVRRGGAAFLRWRPGWLAQLPGTAAIRSPLVAELHAARGLLASSMQRGAVQQLPAMVAQLRVPSLWVAGSRDTVMEPRYVRHLAGYSPSHCFELLEGEGHLLMRTAPQALAERLNTWLTAQQLPQHDQSRAKPRSWRSANCA
ncbi:MAG: alpha/beta hydrolase [Cyanobacteria bacterium M_surface_10_m2_179]|nr:alpha/beta hydrolase [Cyanobacteria bacterium M_surface_10_m2_179]